MIWLHGDAQYGGCREGERSQTFNLVYIKSLGDPRLSFISDYDDKKLS